MERNKIPIFEKFSLVSIMMPYYAPAHKAFLLLSALYHGSRKRLDEYFDGFVNIMRVYSLRIQINRSWGPIRFTLPSTLFQFKIELAHTKDIDDFISFIKRISKSEGRYFNQHYMNNRVLLVNDLITIEDAFIKKLIGYESDLKTIRVASTLTQSLYLSVDKPTLFDTYL